MYQKKLPSELHCPLEYGVAPFVGKWKIRILCLLSHEPSLRYRDLKLKLKDVADTALASSLKELLASELICRTSYDEIPPRVEYSLSEAGAAAIPLLKGLCEWAQKYSTDELFPACSDCRSYHHRK